MAGVIAISNLAVNSAVWNFEELKCKVCILWMGF